MSLRKKLLYKFFPTYRNTVLQRAELGVIHDEINSLKNKYDTFQSAIFQKIEDAELEVIHDEIKSLKNKYDTFQTAIFQKIEDNVQSDITKNFSGHYEYWRAKRIVAIVEEYGEAWFKGKKILELGCGFGDIGYNLSTLGAEVIYAEGRKENCDVLRKRFPNNRVYQVNLENEWPFSSDENFDMILHLGLLYHLKDYHFSLEKCMAHTKNLILETEVCDSDEDFVLAVDEDSTRYDQSLIGVGCRPSASHIESILIKNGFTFYRVQDARCNANIHIYDWPVGNTKTWQHGLRRFWFCKEGGK